MPLVRCIGFAVSVAVLSISSAHAEGLYSPQFPKASWTELRDRGVIKQTLDASCGAASLASLLTYYYQVPVQEIHIIALLDIKNANTYSFKDLAGVTEKIGFKSVFLEMDIEALRAVQIPMIVHLNTIDGVHFSVVRPISDEFVMLMDPAWGNTRLTISQFEAIWYSAGNKGNAMAVLPHEGSVVSGDPEFYNSVGDGGSHFFMVQH